MTDKERAKDTNDKKNGKNKNNHSSVFETVMQQRPNWTVHKITSFCKNCKYLPDLIGFNLRLEGAYDDIWDECSQLDISIFSRKYVRLLKWMHSRDHRPLIVLNFAYYDYALIQRIYYQFYHCQSIVKRIEICMSLIETMQLMPTLYSLNENQKNRLRRIHDGILRCWNAFWTDMTDIGRDIDGTDVTDCTDIDVNDIGHGIKFFVKSAPRIEIMNGINDGNDNQIDVHSNGPSESSNRRDFGDGNGNGNGNGNEDDNDDNDNDNDEEIIYFSDCSQTQSVENHKHRKLDSAMLDSHNKSMNLNNENHNINVNESLKSEIELKTIDSQLQFLCFVFEWLRDQIDRMMKRDPIVTSNTAAKKFFKENDSNVFVSILVCFRKLLRDLGDANSKCFENENKNKIIKTNDKRNDNANENENNVENENHPQQHPIYAASYLRAVIDMIRKLTS